MTNLGNDGCVEFRFLRPAARDATIVGDFNGWRQDLPMRADANGWWTLRVELEPGDYRFRYIADGQWYTDFAANGVEATKQGWNSLLVVPASTATMTKTTKKPAGVEIQQHKQFEGEVLRVA